MSFHLSSKNIIITQENGSTYLIATIRNRNGDMRDTKIRLDNHIGNSDGWFIWGGQGFTGSASDIRLDQTDQGPKLTAELKTRDGSSRGRQGIFLAEKIANEDGHLKYLG